MPGFFGEKKDKKKDGGGNKAGSLAERINFGGKNKSKKPNKRQAAMGNYK